jgi:ADP-ribosylation factor-like protein 3
MLRTIRQRAKRESVPRVLILGLDNAGKTTILKALQGEDPSNTQSTQGFNLAQINVNGARKMNICDLGGQRSLREYWNDYYSATDCLVYVVDSTDSRRLEESAETFRKIVEELPSAPILVFANKQDLATSKPASVIAEALDLVSMRTRKWHIQGCSAKNGSEDEGLQAGMGWLMTNC